MKFNLCQEIWYPQLSSDSYFCFVFSCISSSSPCRQKFCWNCWLFGLTNSWKWNLITWRYFVFAKLPKHMAKSKQLESWNNRITFKARNWTLFSSDTVGQNNSKVSLHLGPFHVFFTFSFAEFSTLHLFFTFVLCLIWYFSTFSHCLVQSFLQILKMLAHCAEWAEWKHPTYFALQYKNSNICNFCKRYMQVFLLIFLCSVVMYLFIDVGRLKIHLVSM